MPKDAKPVSNVEKLQELGLVPEDHTLSAADQKLLATLTPAEIKALATVKTKLGAKRLSRVTKSGRFPHPDTVGF